jgi:predicted  nucleic acid-binding Zn-ribbon protein
VRQKLLDLHEIQKIDLEIRDTEKNREQIEERLHKLEDSVKQVHAEVATLSEQREVIIRETKTLEGTVQAESVKVRKWETRLNEIRNQREYLALSREVEASKRANREAEERILELMAQREAIDKQLDSLQDRLAEEEVDCATERASVERELKEAEEHRTSSLRRREALLPNIPKQLLKKYDFVREKRHGLGLVTVVDGCCQGCNMRLPPQLYNILQRGDSIEQCPTCQRIILWEHFLVGDSPPDGVEATP